MKWINALVIVLLALACNAWDVPSADGAPDFGISASTAAAPAPDLRVWPADDELAMLVEGAAAPRIAAATGLRVAVGDGGWLGLTHIGGGGDWIAIDEGTPETLHETVVCTSCCTRLVPGTWAAATASCRPSCGRALRAGC